MKRFLRGCILALAMFGALAEPALASLRVNPLIVYLEPSGRDSSSVIQLTNVTDIELPFEVTVFRRTVVDGKEVDIPADDDFVIFPPQMIIPAQETQVLRIQWLPQAAISHSESYYVYVTQVPVELKPGMSGVRVNYRFGISAHVVPPGTRSALKVTGVEPATNEDGKKGFNLVVANRGSRYGRVSEHRLSLDNGAAWDQRQINDAMGTGFLLPGQTGTYFLPYDGELPANAQGTLTYSDPN